jgi:glycosyltransferase involved in cell wall biosynthesis
MVTTFYPPYHFGGDAIYVYRLAHALAEAGHRVDVVHSVDAYRLKIAEETRGFDDHPNVVRYPLESSAPRLTTLLAHQLGRPALYERRLREQLERDYDVIHYHNVSLMGAPEVLRFGRALKLYTAHEYWLVCPTHVLFAFDREACTEKQCLACTLRYGRAPQVWRHTGRLGDALEHVDVLLMPSRFAAERHRADGISRPLVVLPHFVPDPRPAALARAAERPFFLYAGRLEKLKGVQDLLPAFADERRADLLIAGEGAYRTTLEASARGLSHVHFLGAIAPARLGELYRRAVALLVPSLCYETFGLSAAEAMSHGTPVVARRIGALEEMLEQSGGGIGFATDAELRLAIDRLLTQPALRASLGARGAAAVRTHWSKAGHLESYLELVRSRLGLPRPAVAVGA